jgi:hypothetical protein
LRFTDPTGHWSIGKFLKGLGEGILSTIKAAFPPYQGYEIGKQIYQLCTNQVTWKELNTPNPGAVWESLKSYYDVTTEEGQGHVVWDVALIVVTLFAGGGAGGGAAAEAATNAESKLNIVARFTNKSSALKALDTLPENIQNAAKRFFQKFTSEYENITVVQNADGTYTIAARVPGKTEGWYAVYTKTISADGKTIMVTQEGFDAEGNLVHHHVKYSE